MIHRRPFLRYALSAVMGSTAAWPSRADAVAAVKLDLPGRATADDVSKAFQAARGRCFATGARQITFPPGRFEVDQPLVIDLQGLAVVGSATTLLSRNQGPAVFELCANGASITNFQITGTYDRVVQRHTGDSYRSDVAIACYNCDHYNISNITCQNFQAGIYASGWRKGGADGRGTGVFQTGGKIKGVAFEHCDFGVIYGVQDLFSIEDLTCRDTTKVVGYEPHAIYATNAFGVDRDDKAASNVAGSGGSGRVRVVNASSEANHYDSCFKFKAHKQLSVSGLHGRDTRILVQFTGCPGLEATGLVLLNQRAWANNTGHDVVWTDAAGHRRQSTAAGDDYAKTSQAIALGYCDHAHITNALVKQSDGYGGLALKLSFSSDVVVDGLTVDTTRRDRSGDHIVTLNDGSDRAIFRRFKYEDAGNGDEEVFSFANSSSGLVDRPIIIGSRRLGVMVGTASNNHLVPSSGMVVDQQEAWRTTGTGRGNVISALS